MKSTVFDIEDVKYEMEKLTHGEVVELEGRVVFRLDSKVINVDITECAELPVVFSYRKHIDSGCNPDKCIADKKRTCGECKFQMFANEVEFRAELLFAQKNDTKRMIATYKIS